MAAPISNPPAADTESKSAKKKKAKAAAAAAAAERTDSPAPTTTSDAAAEDAEHPYIRDIQKTLRNLNKKLSNVAKTEALVTAHPDKSLNDLVAQKIINADQKAQLESKPTLTSQVAQLDEQLSQFKKLQGEFKSKAQAERAELEKSSTSGREKAVADALKEQEERLTSQHDKELNDTLLHLSQFLRLAASRRSEECDPNSDENLAIEGVLLGVYTGDKSAVDCILKLARGTADTTVSVNGEACQTTYAQLKDIAIEFNKPLAAPEAETEAAETAATDPTVANATLTEIRAGDDTAMTNGHAAEEATVETPANAEVANTTNAAGEKWDTGGKDLSTSQEWVNVPSNPEETESPVEAAPAAAANTQSWADDQPEPIAEAATPTDPNDGFQSVPGRRGRDNRGGNYRGRGRGSFRGEGRGRGRGGNRGGAPRGGPRRQEA